MMNGGDDANKNENEDEDEGAPRIFYSLKVSQ